MKLLKMAMPILVMVFIQGCSVANVKPFADETTKVSMLVASEVKEVNKVLEKAVVIDKERVKALQDINNDASNSTIVERAKAFFDNSGGLDEDTKICSMYNDTAKKASANSTFPKQMVEVFAPRICMGKKKDGKASYQKNKKVSYAQLYIAANDSLNSVYNELAQYANQLTALAAAGENGEEAVKSLETHLNSALTLLGFAEVVIASKVVTGIADNFTKIQTNSGLRHAVSTAQPSIEKIAKLIGETIVPHLVQTTSDLSEVNRQAILIDHPSNYIALHNTAYTVENDALLIIKDQISDICNDKNSDKCFSKADLSNFEAMMKFMDKYAKPGYQAIVDKRTEWESWAIERKANWIKVGQLTKLLAKEHHRILGVLDSCEGGSFKKCFEFKPADVFRLAAK